MSGVNTPEAASGWDCHVHVFSGGQSVEQGHYVPQDHPIERIEALAARHGFGHLVLVQPSVYGSDNSLLLASLEASAGRHRGVVVVDEPLPEAQLVTWHELGVRGIRCNWVSPVGNRQTDWRAWTPRLRELGWHVQWYAHGDQLGEVVKWHAQYGLPCVLDHLAGMHTRLTLDAQAWANLQALANAGAWIKLSGWYRLGLKAPYLLEKLRLSEIMAMFAQRWVWGSDWPHTSFAPSGAPTYDQIWQPLQDLLGTEGEQALASQSHLLYGP